MGGYMFKADRQTDTQHTEKRNREKEREDGG